MSKLIYAKSRQGFEAAYSATERNTVDGSAYKGIAFLEDGYIHTHGKYFKIFKGVDNLLKSTKSGNEITLTDSNGGTVKFNIGVDTLSDGNHLSISGSNGALTVNHDKAGIEKTTVSPTEPTTSTVYIPTISFDEYGHYKSHSSNLITATLDRVKSSFISTSGDYYLTFAKTGITTSELNKSQDLRYNPNTGSLWAKKFIGEVTGALTGKLKISINGSEHTYDGGENIDIEPIYTPTSAGNSSQVLWGGSSWKNVLTEVDRSSENIVTSKAIASFVDREIKAGFGANDAMLFKGTVGPSGATLTKAQFEALKTYDIGWTYRATFYGDLRGEPVEPGDMLISTVNRSSGGGVDADWTVVQANIDGAITLSGATGLTKDSLVLGVGSNSIKSLASGKSGTILSGTGGAPKWLTPGTFNIKVGTSNVGSAFDPATSTSKTLTFTGEGTVSITSSASEIKISGKDSDPNIIQVAQDNILEGYHTESTVGFKPYGAKSTTGGRLYTGTANPTLTTRLNYDGYLYATKLYSGGSEVLTSHQSLGDLTINHGTTRSKVYNPKTPNSITFKGIDGVVLSGDKDTGIINIGHSKVTTNAKAGRYVTSTDAYGHVSGTTAFSSLGLKVEGETLLTYTPSGAKTFDIIKGDNISFDSSGTATNRKLKINAVNTWRNVAAYMTASPTSSNEILSTSVGTADLAFGSEFLWTSTKDNTAGELKLGWAEVDNAGTITYTV